MNLALTIFLESQLVSQQPTNTSTQNGVPMAASLGTRVVVQIPSGSNLLDTGILTQGFAAGGTSYIERAFFVPGSLAGQSGQAIASVSSPDLILLASDAELLNVISGALLYGATVDVTAY